MLILIAAAAAGGALAGCNDDGSKPPPHAPTVEQRPPFHVPPFHARSVAATVVPRVGGIHTRFRILIRRPQFVGRRAHAFWGYDLKARQRPYRGGCITDTGEILNGGPARDPARIVLDPSRQMGHIWCHGRFFGRLYYYEAFACPDRGTCRVPRGFPHHRSLVGRFGFSVAAG